MLTGGCQCGAVRYAIKGETEKETTRHILCHCADCRAASGAPATAWMMFPTEIFRITSGQTVAYNSSGNAWRHFCGNCGTGLYYINEKTLPGIVDIQSATLDNADNYKPSMHIQTAERLNYMSGLSDFPQFERYPPDM